MAVTGGQPTQRDPQRALIEQTFVLPFPVSVNNLHQNGKGGKRIRSDAYRSWVTEAGWRLHQQRYIPTVGAYDLTIHAVRPDKRKRDLGNLEKAVSDLLVVHGVVEDDCLASRIVLEWVSSDLQGISVTVRGVPAPGAKIPK